MKIKFGAFVVDGRGKIGGHVASKNRAGAYMRTKVTPVNPQTSFQLLVRSRFTQFSQAWRALSESARTAWNAAVSDFARTDIFGDLKNPTGFNLFQRLNNNLAIVGIAQISNPPLPSAVGVVVLDSISVDVGTGDYTTNFTGPVPANTSVKVYATAPMSPGKSFVKSEYRLIMVLSSGAVSPFVVSDEYIAKFGDLETVGQKFFLKMEAVNDTTGQVGTPSQASTISV